MASKQNRKLYVHGNTNVQVVVESSTFSAVVVEFHPEYNSSLNSTANLQNNVDHFISVINTAGSEYNADIVVFPESALSIEKTFLLPNPTLKVKLCNSSVDYDSVLIDLACAAQNTSTYVVVNLVEQLYNTTLQQTVYFNTDVVFDRNGSLIARYRKIHLYGEGFLEASPDGELVYFDSDFGVRFGLLTCFDIIFKTPGVTLARQYNVSHFIFPTHWFSQMPFLAAIQEQNYWAYSLDVVLLASQYNQPSTGSTGSGIYLGRTGPLAYNMTSLVGTFLIHADVPVQYPYADNSSSTVTTNVKTKLPLKASKEVLTYKTHFKTISESTYEQIYFKRENLDIYTTELIEPLGTLVTSDSSSTITIQSNIERTICQNTLCCSFSLKTLTSYAPNRSDVTRGDDYSQLYYRLVVFDGVKDYDGADTGGLQTCAIIPCVNTSLSSCGLRADSDYAQPYTLSDYYQTEFVFENITITANISNNNSIVGPNILLRGEVENNFGAILSPDGFDYSLNEVNGTVLQTLTTLTPVQVVTFSLYGRLFNRDGDPYTVPSTSGGGSLCNHWFSTLSAILFIVKALRS